MLSDARTQALSALSQFLVAECSMGDTLLRVSELTTEAIPSAQMAGITMQGQSGRPMTAIFTDAEAPEIDTAQYESGNGPCLDSWREQRVVRIDEMSAAVERYPEFARSAQAHGIESTISLPLVAGESGLGALNLYARATNGFSSQDETIGMEVASAAAIVLANASAYLGALRLNEQLSQAIQSRAVIEQAKGILMARSPEITPDGAFDLLRKASQRENVKLREIAQRIVDRKPGSAGVREP